MANDAKSFSLEIDNDMERTEDEFREVVTTVAIEGLSRLVLKTPVASGRARGNWTVSVGSTNTGVTAELDKSGSGAINEGSAVIQNYPEEGWPSIFVQNNLPYIERLENGHSKQAPNGMLAVTFAELKAGFS